MSSRAGFDNCIGLAFLSLPLLRNLFLRNLSAYQKPSLQKIVDDSTSWNDFPLYRCPQRQTPFGVLFKPVTTFYFNVVVLNLKCQMKQSGGIHLFVWSALQIVSVIRDLIILALLVNTISLAIFSLSFRKDWMQCESSR